jgi:hypothetical protein
MEALCRRGPFDVDDPERSMSPGTRDESDLRENLREKNRRLRALRRALAERDHQIEVIRSRRPASADASGASIFFLVGHARSGTSWLMRTLNAHPEILCRGEGRIVGRSYKREDSEHMQSARMQPSSLQRAILDADYLRAWIERSVWTRDDDPERHLNNLTRVAATYFLLDQLGRSGKTIAGDKTPFLSDETIAEIAAIFPDSRIVHIIRDGRDVAVSLMHHLWNREVALAVHDLRPDEQRKRDVYREDPGKLLQSGEGIFTETRIGELAATWRSRVAQAIADGPALFGERYAEVRYEDLLVRPEPELKRLLEFLGADADAQTVSECLAATSFDEWTKGRKRGEEDSSSPLRKGVAGEWRDVFMPRDKRIFDELAGNLLIELGYESDRDWCRERH